MNSLSLGIPNEIYFKNIQLFKQKAGTDENIKWGIGIEREFMLAIKIDKKTLVDIVIPFIKTLYKFNYDTNNIKTEFIFFYY